MTSATTVRLVQILLRSPLLSGARREELLRLQTRFPDSRALAAELVQREWLTSYQLGRLMQGKSDELVVGPYLLLERLGEGGTGHVYKAKHRGLDRVVALKVLRKECLTNPKSAQRFQREIRATAQLSHPNIVRAFDADQAGDLHYIAMEHIEGIDLARHVAENGPLPVALACALVRQAALGLQHAHECGMIHRDIKPANLLVSGGPFTSAGSRAGAKNACQLKILDMGLARWTDPDAQQSLLNLTQRGIVMGTPEFMAPEQAIDSSQCDIRADLYSLGCTFYFLLAGREPFHEGSITDKLIQHQRATPEPMGSVRAAQLRALRTEPPSGAADEVPESVAEVVHFLMAKKPSDRFQTPAELVLVLTEIQRHLEGGNEGAEETSDVPAEALVCESVQTALSAERKQTPRPPWRLLLAVSAMAAGILGLVLSAACLVRF
jgi:serine/threonine-protein kinase